ncbi:arylsulfatase [Singulisphaera sp. Ch08]|uniref:Arylsulfatase n=1 Tax=Singulisphaera sp. Ch08 TaxID=3120278 RepID=A0AAU7CHI6_9BACT
MRKPTDLHGLHVSLMSGFLLALLVAPSSARAETHATADRPNIVYILADDLGYGDVHRLNPDSKIATPNLDRLAEQGMTFTDAHSGSSVCTPTRYGILTGRYAWRSRLKKGVLGGYSPPLIEPGRLTVASLLQQKGYQTACVGKWHLGFDWGTSRALRFGDDIDAKEKMAAVDYKLPITHGPTSVGFDTYYGISASLDMPPYLYIHDDRTVGLPTTEKTYIRKGPAHADFEAVGVLPTLTAKAVELIDGWGKQEKSKSRPFFLYFPLTAPHTPIVPDDSFRGRSKVGTYGDFVMQVDATVGRVLDALERNAMTGSTLVIFTSDNGCSPSADFPALAKAGHHPSGPLRGHKADIFEGGHRIPFLARWPGKVQAGSTCDDTICLTDLLATCAAIVGSTVLADAGEDSVNILPDLLGTAQEPVREATVHHSIDGSFAVRQGPWKLALCPDSGGWSDPRPGRPEAKRLPPVQLFNLERDLGELRNLQAEHPEVVERLTKLLERYVVEGRSTPGPARENAGSVRISRDANR